MRIINRHKSERARAIQQDQALLSLRNTLELELNAATYKHMLDAEDRDNLQTELRDKAKRRYGFRKYLQSLKTRQAIRSNINEYLTVLFIAVAAGIIITHIGLFGAPAYLAIGIPLSTGAI